MSTESDHFSNELLIAKSQKLSKETGIAPFFLGVRADGYAVLFLKGVTQIPIDPKNKNPDNFHIYIGTSDNLQELTNIIGAMIKDGSLTISGDEKTGDNIVKHTFRLPQISDYEPLDNQCYWNNLPIRELEISEMPV